MEAFRFLRRVGRLLRTVPYYDRFTFFLPLPLDRSIELQADTLAISRDDLDSWLLRKVWDQYILSLSLGSSSIEEHHVRALHPLSLARTRNRPNNTLSLETLRGVASCEGRRHRSATYTVLDRLVVRTNSISTTHATPQPSSIQYQEHHLDIIMVRMTVISRIPDGLLLCASMESENDTAEMTQYKNKAKDILKTIVDGTPKCINDPPFYFLYERRHTRTASSEQRAASVSICTHRASECVYVCVRTSSLTRSRVPTGTLSSRMSCICVCATRPIPRSCRTRISRSCPRSSTNATAARCRLRSGRTSSSSSVRASRALARLISGGGCSLTRYLRHLSRHVHSEDEKAVQRHTLATQSIQGIGGARRGSFDLYAKYLGARIPRRTPQ